MLSRRQLLGASGAGALGLLLAGCARRLQPADTGAAGFGEGATGTIAMWCRSETQVGTRQVIDAFHAAQDRLRIDLTPVPSGQYVTKLATAIRGGRVPDLVDADDINSTLFAYHGVFTDVADLVSDLGDPDVFSPGHTELVTFGGRQYGVPFLADDSSLFVNLDLFERAGLDPVESTSSFAGYLDAARAITRKRDGVYGWTAPGNNAGALGFTVQPHVWAGGAHLTGGDIGGGQHGTIRGDEPLRRTLTLFRTMWQEGLMIPRSYSDDASSWGVDFLSGKIAMAPNSYGSIVQRAQGGHVRLESRLLSGPDGGTAFFDGGDNLCLLNGAANASGAWEFVRFATSVAQQQALPKAGYYPIRADADTAAFQQRYPLAVPPLAALDKGYAPKTLSYNRLFNQQDGPWLAMYRRAVFGGDVDGALTDAQDAFDRILQQGDA